jgi:hypothetical protein
MESLYAFFAAFILVHVVAAIVLCVALALEAVYG